MWKRLANSLWRSCTRIRGSSKLAATVGLLSLSACLGAQLARPIHFADDPNAIREKKPEPASRGPEIPRITKANFHSIMGDKSRKVILFYDSKSVLGVIIRCV